MMDEIRGHEMVINPVYERLTRGAGWPSGRSARWLGVGAALLTGAALWYTVTHQSAWPYGWPVSGLGNLAMMGFNGLSLLISPIAAAGIAAGYVRGDDFLLVRISGLSAEAVVMGLVEAAAYRMRVIRALAVGCLPGAVIFFTAPVWSDVHPAELSGLALLVVAIDILLVTFLAKSLIYLGVWLGLRLGRAAGLAAAGIVLALFVLPCALEGFATVLDPTDVYPVIVCTGILVPALIIGQERVSRGAAIRAVERLSRS